MPTPEELERLQNEFPEMKPQTKEDTNDMDNRIRELSARLPDDGGADMVEDRERALVSLREKLSSVNSSITTKNGADIG